MCVGGGTMTGSFVPRIGGTASRLEYLVSAVLLRGWGLNTCLVTTGGVPRMFTAVHQYGITTVAFDVHNAQCCTSLAWLTHMHVHCCPAGARMC